MRVFVTGSTGFIGTHVVKELISAGHTVVGLTRSDAGEEALALVGAEVCRGDVNDPDCIRSAAAAADAVIHMAFDHDISKLALNCQKDRVVIEALGEVLAGSNRPLIVASGTGLVARSKPNEPVIETDKHASSAQAPRAATEAAAAAISTNGGNVVVVRLSQVHDTQHQGRIREHIRLAREKGYVAYVGEGQNHLSAVHISDAARLFRLALEGGRAGAHYHAVGEEGVAMRDIAEAIGTGLKLPVKSLTPEELPGYFGPIASLAMLDLAASGTWTRQELGWNPTGPSFLADLYGTDYSAL